MYANIAKAPTWAERQSRDCCKRLSDCFWDRTRWEREYSANRLYLTGVISKNMKPICSDSNSVAEMYVSDIYVSLNLSVFYNISRKKKKSNTNSIPRPSFHLLDSNLWPCPALVKRQTAGNPNLWGRSTQTKWRKRLLPRRRLLGRPGPEFSLRWSNEADTWEPVSHPQSREMPVAQKDVKFHIFGEASVASP